MKKLGIWILLLGILLGTGAVGAVEEGAWECSAVPEGTAGAQAWDEEVSLWFETVSQEGRATAKRKISIEEGIFSMTFSLEIEGSEEGNLRKILLQNPGTLLITEVMGITGGTLSAFGEQIGTVEENVPLLVSLAVDTQTKEAVVWIEDEIVFQGSVASKWRNFDYDNLELEFRNYTSSKTATMRSGFWIKNLKWGQSGKVVSVDAAQTGMLQGDRVRISFDGVMPPPMYKSENYVLTANGEEIPTILEREAEGVSLRPEVGFLPETEYVLQINRVVDILGNEIQGQREYTFISLPGEYQLPEITLQADAESVYEGNAVEIRAQVEAYAPVDRVEYFVNGEPAYTAYEGDYLFVFNRAAGTYQVEAVAYDNYGGSSQKAALTIEVKENALPEVSFETLTDGVTVVAEDLKETAIRALDADGEIAWVQVEIDGALMAQLTQEPFSVDLSGLEKGRRHIVLTAMDDVGAQARAEYSILITTKPSETTVYENDFETYQSDGAVLPAGGALYGDGKLISADEYGEEHGTVAQFSTEGILVDDRLASGSWIGIPTAGAGTHFFIELDLYLDGNVGSGFRFMLKQPGEMVLALDVSLQNNTLQMKNGSSETTTWNLQPYTWTRLRYEVDLTEKLYNVYINGEPAAQGYPVGATLTAAETRLELFEIQPEETMKFAMDNLRVVQIQESPVISHIGYDSVEQCESVSPQASSITVTLSAPLGPDSVTKDKAHLLRGETPVELKGVSCEGAVLRLELLEPLWSEENYQVRLDETLTLPTGTPLGSPLTENFTTGLKELDVTSLSLVTEGEQAAVKGILVNQSGAGVMVYGIVTVYSGGKMTDMSVTAIEADGDMAFQTGWVTRKAGETIQFYVWDSLTKPQSVATKLYEF